MPALPPESRKELYQHLARGDWKGVDRIIKQHFPRSQNDFRPVDKAALEELRKLVENDPAQRTALTGRLCGEAVPQRSLAVLCLRQFKRGLCMTTLVRELRAVQDAVHGEDDRWRKMGLGECVYNYDIQHKPDPKTGKEDFRRVVRRQDCVGREIRELVSLLLRAILDQEETAPLDALEEFKPFLKRVAEEKLVQRWFEIRMERRNPPKARPPVKSSPTLKKQLAKAPATAFLEALAGDDPGPLKACCEGAPNANPGKLGFEDVETRSTVGAGLKKPVEEWLLEALFDGPESAAAFAMALLPHAPKFPATQLLERNLKLLRELKGDHERHARDLKTPERLVWARAATLLLQNAPSETCWEFLIPVSWNRCAMDLVVSGLAWQLGTSAGGGLLARLWDIEAARPDPIPLEAVARMECARALFHRLKEPESYRDDPQRDSSRDWVRPRMPSSFEEYLRQYARMEYGCGESVLDDRLYRTMWERRGPPTFTQLRAGFDATPLQAHDGWGGYETPRKGWAQVVDELLAIHWITGGWQELEGAGLEHYAARLQEELEAIVGDLGTWKRPSRDETQAVVAAAFLLMNEPDARLCRILEHALQCPAEAKVNLALDTVDHCQSCKPWWAGFLARYLGGTESIVHRGWRALVRWDVQSGVGACTRALDRLIPGDSSRNTTRGLKALFGHLSRCSDASHVAALLLARDRGPKAFRGLPMAAARDRMLRVILQQLTPADPNLAAWHWKEWPKGEVYFPNPFHERTEEELAAYAASPAAAPLVAQAALDTMGGRNLDGRNQAATLLLQNATLLRENGQDLVAIAVQALWGVSSAGTQVATRVLRSLLAQGLTTNQEIADHVEPLLESEEEASWRAVASFLRDLRKQDPSVTIRNPARIQELVARDPPRYARMFKDLLPPNAAT